MSLKAAEIAELLGNVNPACKGYGPMTEATRELIAEDLIEVDMEPSGLWSAKLTPRGAKRLKASLQ